MTDKQRWDTFLARGQRDYETLFAKRDAERIDAELKERDVRFERIMKAVDWLGVARDSVDYLVKVEGRTAFIEFRPGVEVYMDWNSEGNKLFLGVIRRHDPVMDAEWVSDFQFVNPVPYGCNMDLAWPNDFRIGYDGSAYAFLTADTPTDAAILIAEAIHRTARAADENMAKFRKWEKDMLGKGLSEDDRNTLILLSDTVKNVSHGIAVENLPSRQRSAFRMAQWADNLAEECGADA